jgi:hypothetical protein
MAMTATIEAPPRKVVPALRRTPIPLRDPVPARRVIDRNPTAAVPATQGTLLLEPAVPAAAPASDARSEAPAPAAPPEDREWAARFIQAATEVASGLRAPSQLVRWTTPDLHATLTRRATLAARVRSAGAYRAGKPIVRSLVMQPSRRGGAYEVAAVVVDLDRVRAVALRMQRFDHRWRVTDCEIG